MLGGSHLSVENCHRFSIRFSMRTGDENHHENRIYGSHWRRGLLSKNHPKFSLGMQSKNWTGSHILRMSNSHDKINNKILNLKKLRLPFIEVAAIINEDLVKFDYKTVRKLSYFLIISRSTLFKGGKQFFFSIFLVKFLKK